MLFSTTSVEKRERRRAKDEHVTPGLHPHRTQKRRLPGVLTLRDVQDIELRVVGALEGFGLSIPEHDLDTLILDAIGFAYRIERALPPGTALEPILQATLDHRLASRATMLRRAA